MLRHVDQQKPVILVPMVLSAAFDTIDQKLLLNRLKTCFGISGLALKWIISYIRDRRCVAVPHGSVQGPLLFILYTAPLRTVIEAHVMIPYHLYADDTQLYATITPENEETTKEHLEQCCDSIRQWMKVNKLKLNDSKTEAIFLGTPHMKNKIDFKFLRIGQSLISINRTGSVRNLGAYLNSDLCMSTKIWFSVMSSAN